MIEYPMLIFWSDEDDAFIGVAPDLVGCSAFGDTPEEALRELQIAASLWLEAARANSFPIPAPSRQPTLARAS
ncbi:MAG: type II toxin-antitoxin system HicB family antitoxin [Chloroflexia bacterium]|nr:type II toxin-antitoxin system HicB family antitoxin [Chloroflexia bacterium]